MKRSYKSIYAHGFSLEEHTHENLAWAMEHLETVAKSHSLEFMKWEPEAGDSYSLYFWDHDDGDWIHFGRVWPCYP